MQTITKGDTPQLPFVLLDSTTKKPKAEISLNTITVLVAKAGGLLAPVTNPTLAAAGRGSYWWTPTPLETNTNGAGRWYAFAPGTDDWIDDWWVVTPSVGEPVEPGVTEAQIMAAVRHDKATEIGRIAALYPQLVAIVEEPEPVAPDAR